MYMQTVQIKDMYYKVHDFGGTHASPVHVYGYSYTVNNVYIIVTSCMSYLLLSKGLQTADCPSETDTTWGVTWSATQFGKMDVQRCPGGLDETVGRCSK